jgi:hypothetical protein
VSDSRQHRERFDVRRVGKQVERFEVIETVARIDELSCVPRERRGVARDLNDAGGSKGEKPGRGVR